MSTPVIIRKWRDTRTLVAFFPTEPASQYSPHKCVALDGDVYRCVDYRDCVEKHGRHCATEAASLREELCMLRKLAERGHTTIILYRHEMPAMRQTRFEQWQAKYGKEAVA